MLEKSNAICLDKPYENIAMDLRDKGWSVTADFLPSHVITQLRDNLLSHWRQGEFHEAAVGRQSARKIDKRIRSDEIKWLDPEVATPAQTAYWQAIEALRITLNRQLYLGLHSFEAHMSLYRAGSYYRRHLDRFRGVGLREVTTILYLNDNWQRHEGGELRMYADMQAPSALQTFYPLAGQLVVFMSAEFPHEVLPATRQRISMTGWLKKRDSDQAF